MNPIDILRAAGYKPEPKSRWRIVIVMRGTGDRAPLDYYPKFTSTCDAMEHCVKLNASLSPQAIEQIYFDWERIPRE